MKARPPLPALFVMALLAPPAAAQIVPIGPFTGSASEGFETQSAAGMSGFQPCLVGRAFNNQADVCAPVGGGVHVTGGWSYACSLQEHGGTWLFGSTSGSYVEFAFDVPVRKFGGFMGTNTPNQGVTLVHFFDQTHASIGTMPADVINDCTWRWSGWESLSQDIWFIQIVNSAYGGGRVLLDDLELDTQGSGVGTSYCLATPNSTGIQAIIHGSGSSSVSANNLVLTADTLPAGTLGLFYYGQLQIRLPFGNGFQCVGQGTSLLARLPMQQADSLGLLQFAVDTTAPVQAATQISAGSTWCFQAWYMDPAAGGMGYNLSDAIQVVFSP